MSRSALLWEAHWRLRFGVLYLVGAASSFASGVFVARTSPGSLVTGVLCGLVLALGYGGVRDLRKAWRLRAEAGGDE